MLGLGVLIRFLANAPTDRIWVFKGLSCSSRKFAPATNGSPFASDV